MCACVLSALKRRGTGGGFFFTGNRAKKESDDCILVNESGRRCRPDRKFVHVTCGFKVN